MTDGYGHEQFFGSVRRNHDVLRKQLEGRAVRQNVGEQRVRILDFVTSTDSYRSQDQMLDRVMGRMPEILQIDTEQIQRNLNLLPLFGISPDNPITGSAPQAGQSPENVYVHDTTIGGSLIEEIIPVDKVTSHAVPPLFEIAWAVQPPQQPQQQGEIS